MQIIFLTAHGSLESAIAALRHGAHDYLLKPSPTGEILKSVRQGLARQQSERRRQMLLESLESSVRELRQEDASGGPTAPAESAAGGGAADERRLVVGDVTLDLAAHELTGAGLAITLTPTELRLLALLMRQPGEVIGPAQIVREVHGYDASAVEAAEIVRPIVSRLRRKLAELPGAQERLTTVKGAGYRFERRQA
jgi:DNA-binding response OmpR family regulator